MPDAVDRDADALAQSHPDADAEVSGGSEVEARREYYANLRDLNGQPFDPKIHSTNDDGSPKTKRGHLMRKKGPAKGSGRSSSRKAGVTGSRLGAEREVTTGRGPPSPEQAAVVMVETIVGTCSLFMGPRWAPRKERGSDERAAMVSAWTAFYEVRGVKVPPPEVVLFGVMAAYAAPRVGEMIAEGAFKRGAEKAKGWWRESWDWIRGKRGPRPDGRGDGKREEHPRDPARSARAA